MKRLMALAFLVAVAICVSTVLWNEAAVVHASHCEWVCDNTTISCPPGFKPAQYCCFPEFECSDDACIPVSRLCLEPG